MNPKNIGPYMERKEEEDGKEKSAVRPAKANKKRKPVAGEEDYTEN